MIPGIDPTIDYAFKKLFGSEANSPVLLSLLDAVLSPPPDRRIVSLEILNPFNDKETTDDKLSIVDIKARDQLGRLYNVEMQMVGGHHFPERVLYYWAMLFGQQLQEGDDYADLCETISISFVNGNLFPQVLDYHLDFQLRSSRHPQVVFSDRQSMHVVELAKFAKAVDELADPLETWCYFLVHGADLDPNNLPRALRKPAMERAMEVLKMMSQTDLERERYQARVKVARDERSLVRELREIKELVPIAREEGHREGIKEGVADRIHLLQRLMRLAMTPRPELLMQSLDDLESIAAALERQAGVPETGA